MTGTKSRAVFYLAVTAVVAAGVAGGYWYAAEYCVPNLHTVRPGILYRSGQPRSLGLHWLEWKGIRTIVNLRGPDGDAIPEERRFADEHDIRFYSIPVGTDYDSIRRSVTEFLTLVEDPHAWPVLVHCSRGKERTGVMTAAYRISVEGRSLGEALDELYRLGFQEGSIPAAEEVIRTLATGEAPTAAPRRSSSVGVWQD